MGKLWSFEGDLYSESKGYRSPLRKDYDRCFVGITNTRELRSTLRHGKFTSLGGYPLYFLTSDGCALCFDCVKSELYQVIYSIRHNLKDGWKVLACDINYENSELTCEHCNKLIPSAYGEEDLHEKENLLDS